MRGIDKEDLIGVKFYGGGGQVALMRSESYAF